MQIEADSLDLISGPDPIYNDASTFDLFRVYSIARETLDQRGLDNVRVLPNLDLNTEPPELEHQLTTLLDMGVDAIAVRHRPRAYASIQRMTRVLSDKDVWIHLSGIRKRILDGTVAAIHIQPLYSIDSVSAYKSYRPGTPRKSHNDGHLAVASSPSPDVIEYAEAMVEIITPPSVSFSELVRFDASTLGILKKAHHLDLLGTDLNRECLLCRGKDVDDFYNYGLEDERVLWPKYRAHHTVHEL